MIHKKLLSLLVLLMTAASGAWAIGISCSPSYIGRVICTDGSIFVSSTEAAAEGKTAVAVIAYVNTVNKTGLALALTNQGQMNWENAKTSCADKNTSTPVTGGTWKLPSQSEWFQMNQGLGGYTAMNNVFASFGGDNLTNNYWSSTPNGNDNAVYYRSSNGGWGATSRTQNAVFVRACLEFNINLFISDDMTEATMEMPASDVTIDYELVRDLASNVTAVIADRIRIEKSGDIYVPVNPEAIWPVVTDILDPQNPVVLQWATDLNVGMKLQKKGEGQDEWTTVEHPTVGTFRILVTGVDNGLYDGEVYTNEFQMFEGFPVVVPATEEEGGEVDLGTVSFFTEQFNLKLETGSSAKLYTLTAIDGHTVTATEVDVVPAGMPFFVLNETDAEQMVTLLPATAEEVTTTPTPIIEFLGTDVDLTFTQEDMDGAYDYYILHRGIFVWVKDPGTLKAGKCYLRILKGQPTTARRIVFSEATGLRAIENGKLTIENEAGAVYDLSGRRVAAPTKKGVYIQNGRKVVVK